MGAGSLSRRAFTLLEALVTLGIAAALLTLLIPTLQGTIGTARSFKCQMTLRGVALDFSVYADDQLRGWRGRDENLQGGRAFTIETFIESQYGVVDFWRHGQVDSVTLRPGDAGDALRCPLVDTPMTLVRRGGAAFAGGERAIQTREAVSYGFNARLYRSEYVNEHGAVGSVFEPIRSDVAMESLVPLVMDVDALLAVARRLNPLLIAPTILDGGAYGNNRLWHPGMRHRGGMNVAMTSGEVLFSTDPRAEPTWRWEYQPKHIKHDRER